MEKWPRVQGCDAGYILGLASVCPTVEAGDERAFWARSARGHGPKRPRPDLGRFTRETERLCVPKTSSCRRPTEYLPSDRDDRPDVLRQISGAWLWGAE